MNIVAIKCWKHSITYHPYNNNGKTAGMSLNQTYNPIAYKMFSNKDLGAYLILFLLFQT